MKQQQQDPSLFDPKANFNILSWLAAVGAIIFRVFLDSGMGTEALGIPALIAFLVLPCLATFAREPMLITAWNAFTVMAVWRWITSDKRQHTHYIGHPWVISWATLGLLSDPVMRFLEPMLLAGIAYLLRENKVMYRFFIWGAFSLAFQISVQRALTRRRNNDIHNAGLEARRF